MLAQTVTVVVSLLVAGGLAFQLVTLARVGAKIARPKHRPQAVPVVSAPVERPRPRIARRRARDYRTALRAVSRAA